MIKKLLLSLVASLGLAASALAINPLGFTQYGNIPAVDTAVNLHGTFRTIQIWSDPAAADLYVSLQGAPATVGGATCIHLPGGSGYQSPAGCNLGISNVHVIGATATGKYTVAAF